MNRRQQIITRLRADIVRTTTAVDRAMDALDNCDDETLQRDASDVYSRLDNALEELQAARRAVDELNS